MSQTLPIQNFISEGNVRSVNKKSPYYKELRDNIKTIGMETPITYRLNKDGQAVIVNGHQRVQIAKDLKLKNVPCYLVNGKVDDTTRQLSSNLFSVPMSTFEASDAIRKIMKENPEITKKQLQNKFGKSASWVNEAMLLSNVDSELMSAVKLDMTFNFSAISDTSEYYTDSIEFLMKIGKYSLEVQHKALDEFISGSLPKVKNPTILEVLDGYNDIVDFLDDVLRTIRPFDLSFNDIKEHVDEKDFRQSEKDEGIVHTYTHSLFQEYEEEKFCSDMNFLARVFSEHTESGKKFFKELPINTDLRGWEDNNAHLSWAMWSSKSSFYSQLKEATNTPFSEVKLISWNGRITNVLLEFEVLKKTQTTDSNGKTIESLEEKDKFQSSYNKVNKFLYDTVADMAYTQIRTSLNNDHDQNVVLKWLLTETKNVPDFSSPMIWDEEETEHHPCRKMLNIEEDHLSNNGLIVDMAEYWFDQFYNEVTYKQLDKLFIAQKMEGIAQQIAIKYAADEEFRENYLKCFSLDALRTMKSTKNATNKKTAIELASKGKNIPFAKYLFTVYGQSSQGLLKEYAK